jgi:HAE1 family hydrophobic/amphiphilic exporter-1
MRGTLKFACLLIVTICMLAPSLHAAAPDSQPASAPAASTQASSTQAVQKLDLAGLLERARKAPVVAAARAGADAAHAKADEIGNTWLPHFDVTAVLGPSPEIHCMPSPAQCITTEPSDVGHNFTGVFGRVDVTGYMPVYTFGKLSAGMRAADAGARAADALADASEADTLLDTARAYYAVKLARELIFMLEEGRDDIDDALKRVEKQLAKGSGEVTEQDRHRLRAFRAEAEARLSEARKLEATALAGVRYFAGDPSVDVDDAPLAAVSFELPELPAVRAAAVANRPERRAALAGVDAAGGLEDLEDARWWPDLVLLAQFTLARAGGADDPANAFANNPYNVTSVAGGVALRWSLDPGTRGAQVHGAEANVDKARATVDLATSGVAAEAERAHGDVRDARDRLAASKLGEKEARAWLVSTLQATQAGLADPKDLADALLAWFNMRARVLQATFDWNVAVLALDRATGVKR